MKAAAAAQPAWDALGGEERASLLNRVADLYEQHREEFFSLCMREAGKTLPDAVLEVREAVDFLRYYASEARTKVGQPVVLPGPTGELNQLRPHGRGVFACISPWNFPLAIFTGPVAAALAAGNAAIAKPAEQTPLIGALAIKLMQQAGIPKDVVQLLPGDGRDRRGPGQASGHRRGSLHRLDRDRARHQSLAGRARRADHPIHRRDRGAECDDRRLLALPEQVTRDVVASSFQSAGQRCSALRVLFVQDDVADSMLAMISGAMQALTIGDPRDIRTDVGPVIDPEAKAALDGHVADMEKSAKRVARLELPASAQSGSFVSPAIYEITSLKALKSENLRPGAARRALAGRRTGQGHRGNQRQRLRAYPWPAEPHRHRPGLRRGSCPGRQYLRQPQPDRRRRGEPAVWRGGPQRHRSQGRRPALCAAFCDGTRDLHRYYGGGRQCFAMAALEG